MFVNKQELTRKEATISPNASEMPVKATIYADVNQ